jgi:hypothetical protein
MADVVAFAVDKYKSNVKELKSASDYDGIATKPRDKISGNAPSWLRVLEGSAAIFGAMNRQVEALLASAADFEAAADMLAERDRALAAATGKGEV